MIGFADLSHHQEDVHPGAAGDVDLLAYRRAGHDRIAFKVTEGIGFVDPWFREWWRQAGALGLARVGYHFARAANHGADELDHVLAVLASAGGLGPRDRLCLDTEDTTALGRADEHAAEFTAAAVTRGVTTGLVYSGRWYAEPGHLRPDDVAPGWRRLWISDYGTRADDAIVLPTGWARDQVAARQIGSAVRVPGVSTPCDYSRVLRDWLPPPIVPPPAAPATSPREGTMQLILFAGGVRLVGAGVDTAVTPAERDALLAQGMPLWRLDRAPLLELAAKVAAQLAAARAARPAAG